jgi:general stress protein YciG
MNPKDSGCKGGIRTRDNHPSLCPLCGSLVKSQFYSEVGQAGGEATLNKYGREHYQRAGRMGGRGNKRIPAAESSGLEIQEGSGVTSSLLTPGSS